MKFTFRVDASTKIGVGHVMRCLTLAKALRDRGAEIRFICRILPGNLISLIKENGFSAVGLRAPPIYIEAGEDYATWLGVAQEDDAKETVAALEGETPDWLIVDHYGLNIQWEQTLRPNIGKMMVIDDLANRRHECDVLLDQNYRHKAEVLYRNLTPNNCVLLTGPRYALLNDQYRAYRKITRQHNGKVSNVLLFFGGSDLYNMTGLALEALSARELCHLSVDVIVGANNRHQKLIEGIASKRSRVLIHSPRPHLADLLARADLAIGAGGVTTWERMCLGVPTVAISVAENQVPACIALAEDGLIAYLGSSMKVDAQTITRALLKMIQGSELVEMSTRGRNQVDGLGVLRVVESLMPSSSDDIRLRNAELADISTYFDWVNEPAVRRSAIDSQTIAWDVHKVWFEQKVLSKCARLYVMNMVDLPVGQIRFDCDGEKWILDYSLDVIVRGRGLGSKLVALGVDEIWKIAALPVYATIKRDNKHSYSVVEKLGFTIACSNSSTLTFVLTP